MGGIVAFLLCFVLVVTGTVSMTEFTVKSTDLEKVNAICNKNDGIENFNIRVEVIRVNCKDKASFTIQR